MTAQPQDFPAIPSTPEKNLRAIRTALVTPQDREAFDSGLKAVLDEVRVSLDLSVLNAFVHRWWISACDSAKDPEGRRQMHAKAEQITAGKQALRGKPWRKVLTERGVEL
ncbi:DUF6247 family protein [Planobispora longispora]|uniref:Uncharacterized protein n=1 Tax=Planobispora longispora TaxID=28887 RepID=A0A8J3RJY6_9ACTN|nr:DUF6247 family protein [Planobispora longispora]BFE85947.1 hypothetical protein GCM10020093_085480 [Planobispora longispora]GIH76045.1 hypothetical protein Plo01_24740 [Planobispora longispora]